MRKIVLATLIAALVIAGSGWTLIRAFDDPATEEPAPPGADARASIGEAVLRVEGPASFGCGTGEIVLTIVLDELKAIPPRSDRLTGFQARITFDPRVVQAERFELDDALAGKGSAKKTRVAVGP